MPFSSYYLDEAGHFQKGLTEDDIKATCASGRGLLWVDVGDTNPDDVRFLERAFRFHQLTLDDCLETRIHTPTVYEFGEYLFLVLHGIGHSEEPPGLEAVELDLFVGPNYVVTNHNFFLSSVAMVMKQVEDGNGRALRRGPDFLVHALCDTLISNIVPTIDKIVEDIDDIEEVLFQRPDQGIAEAILNVKRAGMRLRRVVAPQREVLRQLSHREFDRISEDAEVFYRDIYDHLFRIESSIGNLRERADNIFATYLSAMANQQNEAMRSLAVITAVFLPLTLVAGIYGMNFEHMPELKWGWSYFALLGFMGTVGAATLTWFWVRRWIRVGRKPTSRHLVTSVHRDGPVGNVIQLVQKP